MRSLSNLWLVLLLALSFLVHDVALAKRRGGDAGGGRDRNPPIQSVQNLGDADLIRAVNDRRHVHFVRAGKVKVSKILPDDRHGRPHQRWYVRLSNGEEVFCVYNLDLGQHVPLQIGDEIVVAGEFKWTERGPLIHWLHYDPRGNRPDGYVVVNGVFYGAR